jgi:hypothetical protein
MDSIDTSDTDGLRNPPQFFLEINVYQLIPPAVTLPFGIQDQVPAAIDVLVEFKAVFPPHPHELAASRTDQEF